ncbi:MAG: class I SAM-dependent methyltransferase [Hyphomicrobiaceae bacterium]
MAPAARPEAGGIRGRNPSRKAATALDPMAIGFSGRERRRIVPEARGVVLEVGSGIGHNLPLYDASRIERILVVGAAERLVDLGLKQLGEARFDIEVRPEPVETLAIPSASVDTVVATYSLCSLEKVEAALHQIRRVLKPDGRLLFCERGRSHRRAVARWQDRIDPIWALFSGGGHINRNVSRLVENAGFRIEFLDASRGASGPGILTCNYVGIAVPK